MLKRPRGSLVAPTAQAPMQPEPKQQQLQIDPFVIRPKKRSDLSMLMNRKDFLRKIFFIALASVVIIQTWFRRRRALFEMRRKTAWTIYQNIEYAGEQDQLKVFY
jgi:hypothetical protein